MIGCIVGAAYHARMAQSMCTRSRRSCNQRTTMDIDILSRNVAVLPDADISEHEICESDGEVGASILFDTDDSEFSRFRSDDGGDFSGFEDEHDDGGNQNSKHIQPKWQKIPVSRRKSKIPRFDVHELSIDKLRSPVQYFYDHWTDCMTELVVSESNKYASQNGYTARTTAVEVNKLLGAILKMGVIGMPRSRMYWSEGFRIPSICNTFSRNRFESLLQILHFSDNNEIVIARNDPAYDRLAKIKPLLDKFREQCLKAKPAQVQCIDEQIIPFKGRHSLKQYVKNKPKKWGFKVFSRNSNDGYMHDFFIYNGNVNVSDSCGFVGGDVVIRLCEHLDTGCSHLIYFDNFFNFPELMLKLSELGFKSCGTLRKDRLRGFPLEKDSVLRKKGRGSYVCLEDKKSKLQIVQWFDNKSVVMSSNFLSIEPIRKVKRWDKTKKCFVEVNCPDIVYQYNQSMGGTDLYDMFMALYRIDRKSRVWYIRIFFWVLSSCVVQGWILYKRDCEALQIPERNRLDLLDFTNSIGEALLKCDTVVPSDVRKRGRPRMDQEVQEPEVQDPGVQVTTPKKRLYRRIHVPDEVRYDCLNHWPQILSNTEDEVTRKRCVVCSKKSRTYCTKCEVSLCIKRNENCFIKYHTV